MVRPEFTLGLGRKQDDTFTTILYPCPGRLLYNPAHGTRKTFGREGEDAQVESMRGNCFLESYISLHNKKSHHGRLICMLVFAIAYQGFSFKHMHLTGLVQQSALK